jgi:hypothetical protein
MANEQTQLRTAENAGRKKLRTRVSEWMARKTRKVAPYMVAGGLALSGGALKGCSNGEEDSKSDAGTACYYEKDKDGKEQCLPPTQCEEVPANKDDAGAGTTGPVNESGTQMCVPIETADAGVTPDSGDVVSCDETETADVTTVTFSKNGGVNGNVCDTSSCESPLSTKDSVALDKATCNNVQMDSERVTMDCDYKDSDGNEVKGKVVALVGSDSVVGSCKVKSTDDEPKGDCSPVLGAELIPTGKVEQDKVNYTGRVTLEVDLHGGSQSRLVMLTENGSEKTLTFTDSSGDEVVAELKLVKVAGKTAYIAGSLTEKNTNTTFNAPLGVALDNTSVDFGTEALHLHLNMKLGADNVNAKCTDVENLVEVTVQQPDGSEKTKPDSVKDGKNLEANGTKLPAKTNWVRDAVGNVKESFMALVTGDTNGDVVFEQGEEKDVGNDRVKYVKTTVNSTNENTTDAGVGLEGLAMFDAGVAQPKIDLPKLDAGSD